MDATCRAWNRERDKPDGWLAPEEKESQKRWERFWPQATERGSEDKGIPDPFSSSVDY